MTYPLQKQDIGHLGLVNSCSYYITIMNLSYSRYRKEWNKGSRGESHGEESSSKAGGRFSRVHQWVSPLVAEGFMACAVVVFPDCARFILLYFLSCCSALLEMKPPTATSRWTLRHGLIVSTSTISIRPLGPGNKSHREAYREFCLGFESLWSQEPSLFSIR